MEENNLKSTRTVKILREHSMFLEEKISLGDFNLESEEEKKISLGNFNLEPEEEKKFSLRVKLKGELQEEIKEEIIYLFFNKINYFYQVLDLKNYEKNKKKVYKSWVNSLDENKSLDKNKTKKAFAKSK
jgi:hypothetical protein